MLALMLENQPNSPFPNLRRITCRMSSHNSSLFSQDGAPGKPGRFTARPLRPRGSRSQPVDPPWRHGGRRVECVLCTIFASKLLRDLRHHEEVLNHEEILNNDETDGARRSRDHLGGKTFSEPAGTTTVAGNAGFTRPGADAVHSCRAPAPKASGTTMASRSSASGVGTPREKASDGGANEGSKTTSSPPGR